MALRRRDATVSAIPNSMERLGKEDEGCTMSHSNPLESTHVNMSSCSLEKKMVSHSRYLVAPANGDSGSFLFMPTEDSISLIHSKDMCQEFAENEKFPIKLLVWQWLKCLMVKRLWSWWSQHRWYAQAIALGGLQMLLPLILKGNSVRQGILKDLSKELKKKPWM